MESHVNENNLPLINHDVQSAVEHVSETAEQDQFLSIFDDFISDVLSSK